MGCRNEFSSTPLFLKESSRQFKRRRRSLLQWKMVTTNLLPLIKVDIILLSRRKKEKKK